MYKLYDTVTKPYAKPNVEIIKRILGEYLSGINEINLTEDGCYKCLTHGYINEKRTDDISLEDL